MTIVSLKDSKTNMTVQTDAYHSIEYAMHIITMYQTYAMVQNGALRVYVEHGRFV